MNELTLEDKDLTALYPVQCYICVQGDQTSVQTFRVPPFIERRCISLPSWSSDENRGFYL